MPKNTKAAGINCRKKDQKSIAGKILTKQVIIAFAMINFIIKKLLCSQ